MCGDDSIKTMIALAKTQEQGNPQEAAKLYLEAADALLKESFKHPDKEDRYVDLANKSYIRSKELQGTSRKDKKIAIVKKSDNPTSFKDIGGLEQMKEEIRFKIIEPLKNPDVFNHYGKSIGGGILMYGPPGCGKSLIAKATAHEAQATFIHVKSSDLKSKFVGETEKNIAELFKKAREQQPTIIFFDEFEVLGADRTESLSYDRAAVSQLLVEMDGMDAKGQKILLLAATNEPWSIDPALRREGRFGKTIFIPPPDTASRKQILKLHMNDRPTDDLDYDLLAEETKGLSGADLKAIAESATDIPLKESFSTQQRRDITMIDMMTAIRSHQSVLKQWYEKAQEQVRKRNLGDSFVELGEKAEG